MEQLPPVPPIKKGYLCRPQKGMGLKKWVKRWALLYPASDGNPPRLETYDNKEASTKEGAKPTTLTLSGSFQTVPTTQHRSRDFVLEISVDDKVIVYAVDSKEELDSWLEVFKEVSEVGAAHRVVHTHRASVGPDLPTFGGDTAEGLQENTLYDSYETMTFVVAIKPTPFSEYLGLYGTYSLLIDSVKLSLLEENTNNLLFAWPYRYLRRYGRDKTSFSMEAGRKCESGPGLIVFETKEGNDIFHNIQTFVNNISGRQLTPPVHSAKDTHPNTLETSKKSGGPVKSAPKPPPVAPRSHTMDPMGAITESSVFRQKLAERKGVVEHTGETQAVQTASIKIKRYKAKDGENAEKRPPQPSQTKAQPEPDPLYSEVQDNMSQQTGEPVPPIPESEVYDDLVECQESTEYDFVNATEACHLYDTTPAEEQGDRWKDFGRTEDNIHTETYMKGFRILEDEGGSSEPEVPVRLVVKPIPVTKLRLPSKQAPLPKARSAVRNKTPKVTEAVPETFSDETYDTVVSSAVPSGKVSSSETVNQDMYDHFVRTAVPQPVPLPRKTGPTGSQTQQINTETELYDHLQREANTGNCRAPPKAKQQPFYPDDTYDVLVPDDQLPAGTETLSNQAIGTMPPEESQYSESFLATPVGTSDTSTHDMEENLYDVVAYQ